MRGVRLPAEVARITGAAIKNPKRFKGRSEHKVGPLGSPPKTFSDEEVLAWNEFKDELPWLGKSDRTIVMMASRLRVRIINDPEMGLNAMSLLKTCLTSMGGTPVDRTKVKASDETRDDPTSEFFN